MTTPQPAALPEHTIGKHDHPEPHTMCWSDLELGAIKRYAESYALAALQSQPAALSEPALLGAIARGWCHPKNSGKEVDADLAAAIASEILSINPAQPAAAEVSDAEADDDFADKFDGWIETIKAAHDESLEDLHKSSRAMLRDLIDEMEASRAILALRPQSEPVGEDLGKAFYELSCQPWSIPPDWSRLNQRERDDLRNAASRFAAMLRPQAVPMTEADLLKCLIQANCLGTVHMSHEHGPYYIDRPSHAAVRLKDAMEAHHGITAPAGGEG